MNQTKTKPVQTINRNANFNTLKWVKIESMTPLQGENQVTRCGYQTWMKKHQNLSLKLNEPQIAENNPHLTCTVWPGWFLECWKSFYPSVLTVIIKNEISPSVKCIHTKVQTYWPKKKITNLIQESIFCNELFVYCMLQ